MRRHGFDVLVVLAAGEAVLEVLLRRDAADYPETTLWFTIPATALVILPLLARHRFPFAGPAAVWVVGAAVSFVDGRIVVFTTTASVAGMAAAFLLGNLRDSVRARVGLAVVLFGAGTVVYHAPDSDPAHCSSVQDMPGPRPAHRRSAGMRPAASVASHGNYRSHGDHNFTTRTLLMSGSFRISSSAS